MATGTGKLLAEGEISWDDFLDTVAIIVEHNFKVLLFHKFTSLVLEFHGREETLFVI